MDYSKSADRQKDSEIGLKHMTFVVSDDSQTREQCIHHQHTRIAKLINKIYDARA